jgi:hypothetical protein
MHLYAVINQITNTMKKLYVIFTAMFFAAMLCNFSFAQVSPDSPEYQELKAQGLLEQPKQIKAIEPVVALYPAETGVRNNDLHIPRDGSFIGPLEGCDDCSTGPYTLPFTFCFYGTDYTSFYLNTNGNVSFEGPYSTYSATGFPINDFGMLAPFWGDVVTWDCGSGKLGDIYYKIESNRVVIIWENVGYFGCGGDKRNTFELIFTDGNDPLIGVGNNVAFSYGDMQWTTGDASGGDSGFGGIPATVGVNKGDGVKYALVGRFDHEGTDYDGAGGNTDGVSYLDGKYYTFDACGEDVIIPDPEEEIPLSNWALFIGIGMILVFAVIRFRRLL